MGCLQASHAEVAAYLAFSTLIALYSKGSALENYPELPPIASVDRPRDRRQARGATEPIELFTRHQRSLTMTRSPIFSLRQVYVSKE